MIERDPPSHRPADDRIGNVGIRRDHALERIARDYQEYATSGRSDRWTRPSPGEQRSLELRDDWIDRNLPRPCAVMLDLGCGTGALPASLERRGRMPKRYIGIDINEDRLAIARSRVPHAELMRASADEIPLRAATVDVVVAMTLFSSLADEWLREAVATEIRRVVRPGGMVLIYDIRLPSPGNPNVRPLTAKEIEGLFPGAEIGSRTMTLLPLIARSRIASSARAYDALHRVPLLRSHRATVVRM